VPFFAPEMICLELVGLYTIQKRSSIAFRSRFFHVPFTPGCYSVSVFVGMFFEFADFAHAKLI
jgi:hypothetical protein